MKIDTSGDKSKRDTNSFNAKDFVRNNKKSVSFGVIVIGKYQWHLFIPNAKILFLIFRNFSYSKYSMQCEYFWRSIE